MNDETNPQSPTQDDGPIEAYVDEGISPDSMMGDFKGKPLLKILGFVLILHVVVIGVLSIGFLSEQVLGESSEDLTDDQRMDQAVREVTEAVREIAEKYEVNKQDLASRFGDDSPRPAAAPAEGSAESDEPAAPADGTQPDEAGSEYEEGLEQQLPPPADPELGGNIDEEEDIFPEP